MGPSGKRPDVRRGMNIAARMARLGTESAFEVLARAKALERAGREIVHLEIGEPDFDTPAHIREAASLPFGDRVGLALLRKDDALRMQWTRRRALRSRTSAH